MKYEVPISPRKSHDENDGLSHDSTRSIIFHYFPQENLQNHTGQESVYHEVILGADRN
jgi:hypothetical protein